MYSLIAVYGEEVKKENGVNKNIIKNIKLKRYLMLCLIKKWWDITWREFKVNCIELELILFAKLHCLILMIKYTY